VGGNKIQAGDNEFQARRNKIKADSQQNPRQKQQKQNCCLGEQL
jgi:hypothetical protein